MNLGYKQKATHEARNLPARLEDRTGPSAENGVKKYYVGDTEYEAVQLLGSAAEEDS